MGTLLTIVGSVLIRERATGSFELGVALCAAGLVAAVAERAQTNGQ